MDCPDGVGGSGSEVSLLAAGRSKTRPVDGRILLLELDLLQQHLHLLTDLLLVV